MAWHNIITSMATNLGISFEVVILLLVVFGSIIFMARDFKLGIILLMIGSGCLTMLFYFFEVNFYSALTVFFMSLVILAFSLYAVAKTSQAGGLI